MRDHDFLSSSAFEEFPAENCDLDDSAGLMLGLVVVSQILAFLAAATAIGVGSGWLIALVLHLLVGTSALLGAAVLVATAPVRSARRLRQNRRVAEVHTLHRFGRA